MFSKTKPSYVVSRAALALLVFGLSSEQLSAQDPWQELSDPAMAINNPDKYAWKLFVALNWPAKAGSCEPDTSKNLGDPAEGPVVWESWASRLELYPRFFQDPTKEPEDWNVICANTQTDKLLSVSGQEQAVEVLAAADTITPLFTPPGGDISDASDEEVRLNQQAFSFIRENELYKRAKLAALAAERKALLQSGNSAPIDSFVQFPTEAKEVKAHWVRIDLNGAGRLARDKKRYHWATRKSDNAVFGLVALHITTKDLPNWFWATWEHVDAETLLPSEFNQPGSRQFAGWIVSSVDRVACPKAPHDCNQIPVGFGLENTKWENYRLRATQTSFVDSTGESTIVVNSKIENGFDQQSSSCMSCHALAAADAEAVNTFPLGLTPPGTGPNGFQLNYNGVQMNEAFKKRANDPGKTLDDVITLDFVWSLRHAN